MPKRWNDSTDRLLLLSMLRVSSNRLPDWNVVAKEMGEGYTASGIRPVALRISDSTCSS